MFDLVEPGRGVTIETVGITEIDVPYTIELGQTDDRGEFQQIVLNEDEMMKVVEAVCKERPEFSRGVARIYFRQQKAKRKVAA